MRKIIAKLFAKLLGYTYLERADCMIPTRRNDEAREIKRTRHFDMCMSWFNEPTGEITKDVEEFSLLYSFQQHLESRLHRIVLLQKGVLSPNSSMEDYYGIKDYFPKLH